MTLSLLQLTAKLDAQAAEIASLKARIGAAPDEVSPGPPPPDPGTTPLA